MDGSFHSTPLILESEDRRTALTDALRSLDVLSESDARQVRSILKDSRDPLDQIICRLGFGTEEAIASAYSRIFDYPQLDTESAIVELSNEIIELINRSYLYSRRVAPIEADETSAVIAIVDPSDQEAVAGLAFALQRSIVIRVATATQLDRILAVNFPESDSASNDDVFDASSDIDHLKDMASAEPVVRYVNRLISEAARRRASDIHIEPMARQTAVRLRIDGRLAHFETLGQSQALSVVSRLKILADLDIAEQRRPQDGRMSFSVGGRGVDLRLSTSPTVNGESLVIRLLDQSRAPLSLEGLGFDENAARKLQKWIDAPNGIILLTGPTGSGKTTTLYALLRLLATGERKILTIEDPVEYNLPGVNQSQVNPAIGVTFENALRSFLRHDPDVIMVGEMRDVETARIAMRAAMTGHLVLSTLHTNDAPSAVTRLLDMGVEDYLVSSALLGVVGQRLVRRACSSCGGNGCAQCENTGFTGRIVISELLEVDNAVRAQIKRSSDASDILRAAETQQFQTMLTDGEHKVASGLTLMSEVSRAVGRHAD